MDVLNNIYLWVVLLCLAGVTVSWRFWVHYRSQIEIPVQQPPGTRQLLIAWHFLILFVVGLVWSLGNLIYPRVMASRSAPLTSQTATAPVALDPTLPVPPGLATATPETTPTSPPELTPENTTGAPPSAPQTARIGNTNEFGVNVRSEPGLIHPIIDKLSDGERVTLLGPSESADGFTWKNIQLENGRQGWIVDNFLIPEN